MLPSPYWDGGFAKTVVSNKRPPIIAITCYHRLSKLNIFLVAVLRLK